MLLCGVNNYVFEWVHEEKQSSYDWSTLQISPGDPLYVSRLLQKSHSCIVKKTCFRIESNLTLLYSLSRNSMTH